jgi:hypothetical protein
MALSRIEKAVNAMRQLDEAVSALVYETVWAGPDTDPDGEFYLEAWEKVRELKGNTTDQMTGALMEEPLRGQVIRGSWARFVTEWKGRQPISAKTK